MHLLSSEIFPAFRSFSVRILHSSMIETPLHMENTPLHVAASHNHVEVVKFLLELKTVDLEARNMYEETPLHVAAKNGCDEVAQLLLSHGASTEAKGINGVTPLHLSLSHSLIAQDNSIVETLLKHNADCSAKDNGGMTALDHLSQGSENEKLRSLINFYLEEQRKHRAIEAWSETKAKIDELEKELSNIVGLDGLKLQLRAWAQGLLLHEFRNALGIQVGNRRPPHFAFLGNPGTGKTMVARILGKLLFMVGILAKNNVKEVQRTDLVAEYIGQTGEKTRKVLNEADGGILFVDEAYRLMPTIHPDQADYGLEALEEIMSMMDNRKTVVIFAGYPEPMKRVISSNEGFRRRVTNFFTFDDFSSEDLANILILKMNNQTKDSTLYGFKLDTSCTDKIVADLIESETTEKLRNEMNGGLVDHLLVNAREHLDSRLDFDCLDTEKLLTITLEDLQGGIIPFSKTPSKKKTLLSISSVLKRSRPCC
ncbi:hypothetical protein QVD17_27591 [Tagetes erecta]|uniref:AAA+ ATPase domain-containing protein n=1 Tax=Tagetes erecta TaxID=13708 RepID=A0AAD8KBP8_TARER|nr:hypothetical protein QVD17_27591 [Tagetes erecta]